MDTNRTSQSLSATLSPSSTALARPNDFSKRVNKLVGELAMTLNEDLNPLTQTLMVEQLLDLPMEALQYAIDRWLKGDSSHLSEFEQSNSPIGKRMPKPAELRLIAVKYLRDQRAEQRDRDRREQLETERRHVAEHPEEYEPTEAMQAKITEMNQRLSFNRIVEMPTEPFVEMKREDVMRLSIPDLEALIGALRIREARAAQKEVTQ